ncbi:hypothetical protein [Aliikangiella maris]|uniref:Uncharacterized protein n=2 Tax=Aliikangiella maris TaxID=3162458 RepID=A0ABV3MSU3_9GAMM
MRNLLGLFILILASCSKHDAETPYEINRTMTVVSGAGHEAYIVEASREGSSNTQVIVDFAGGERGAGAVNSLGTELDLLIEWKDNETLVVSKPVGVDLSRNASGEVLQCGEQKVDVIIENYETAENA